MTRNLLALCLLSLFFPNVKGQEGPELDSVLFDRFYQSINNMIQQRDSSSIKAVIRFPYFVECTSDGKRGYTYQHPQSIADSFLRVFNGRFLHGLKDMFNFCDPPTANRFAEYCISAQYFQLTDEAPWGWFEGARLFYFKRFGDRYLLTRVQCAGGAFQE